MIRFFDTILGLLFIMTFCWLFVLVGVFILIASGRPIFFKQERAGLNGQTFKILKFRTMTNHKGKVEDVKQAHLEQNRLYFGSAFLRETNVDELPQIINVIKGDMSLVGWRPHEITQDQEFSQRFQWYRKRNIEKPGITGLAQISGFQGPILSKHFLRKRVAYDRLYNKNKTVILYFKILFMTAKQLFHNLAKAKYTGKKYE